MASVCGLVGGTWGAIFCGVGLWHAFWCLVSVSPPSQGESALRSPGCGTCPQTLFKGNLLNNCMSVTESDIDASDLLSRGEVW